jgi:hypothetical protein
MTKGLLAAALAVAIAGPGVATAMASEAKSVSPSIVGGHNATETYSFMASFQNLNGGHFCGAALIRPTWIVTAAHCVAGETPSGVQFRIGSTNRTSGGVVAKAKRFVNHGTADTSLVELTAPVALTPVSVRSSAPAGSPVRIIGWGCTASPACGPAPTILQETDTTILPDSQCNTGQYELCLSNAGGKSACYGDSGGPALIGTAGNWQIVGDTHGGPSVCGTDVFTYAELPTIKSWIDSVAGPDGGGPTPPPPSTNLALNKPATSSAACNTNETAAKAVNGSVSGGNSDKWCSAATDKTLTVDLGSAQKLSKLVVKHAGAGGESAGFNTKDFTLAVSSDNTTWTTVATVTGNTANTTEHAVTATGRYVRLTVTTGASTGANIARIYELEAYA